MPVPVSTVFVLLALCIGLLMAWRLLGTTVAVEDALTGAVRTEVRPKVPMREGPDLIVEDRVLLPATSALPPVISSPPSAAPTNAAAPTVPRLRKVLVPAIYKEWQSRYPPFWFWNTTFQLEYGYEVVLYQKLNASAPYYIPTNRGCENGAYFNYIVDHYHDFPDIAVFVHARPEEHMTGNGLAATMTWLDSIKCLRPNMTYQSLNIDKFFCRNSWNGIWAKKGIWIEQCLRDTLQVQPHLSFFPKPKAQQPRLLLSSTSLLRYVSLPPSPPPPRPRGTSKATAPPSTSRCRPTSPS